MPEGQEAHGDASSPYPPEAYGEGAPGAYSHPPGPYPGAEGSTGAHARPPGRHTAGSSDPFAEGYAPEAEDQYAAHPRGAHAAGRPDAYIPPPRAAYGEGPPEPHPMPGPATPPPSRVDRVQVGPVVPRRLARLPYAFVLCGVAAGLAVVATNHFRRGSMLIAAAVFIGALARLLLPESQVGMLAVRRRWLDVLLMTTAAVGITLVAFVAKGTTG
jgi:Protein of unknown function (DUF3017)